MKKGPINEDPINEDLMTKGPTNEGQNFEILAELNRLKHVREIRENENRDFNTILLQPPRTLLTQKAWETERKTEKDQIKDYILGDIDLTDSIRNPVTLKGTSPLVNKN